VTDEQTHQTQRTEPASAPRVLAGRYALLGELGRGGMGVVWRAEDRVIGRQVAIKELRLPDGAEEAGVFQERVLREVRTGGMLNEPSVVTVFDVVSEAGTTHIVMELVEAPTLSDIVRRQGALPPAQVARIGEQVLSALSAAHEAGIVHRDVKPGNIMVGANGRVKLTDFGIAQAVDDPRLTTSGMIVGSPAFMAPERISGREALAASDLWSLGATLFFAVEGFVAFERATTAATLHAIMTEVPYLTHAQGPLASAIMGMLITSPEARLTADQARGLLAIAAGPGGQSTPPGGQTSLYTGQAPAGYPPPQAAPAPSPAPQPGRRAALVTVGAILGVGLLVGALFLGRQWGTPATDPAMQSTLTYGEGGDIPALNLSSSQNCLNTQLSQGHQLAQSNWVQCTDPHFAEWYDNGNPIHGESSYTDVTAATYPGLDRVKQYAEAKCAAGFYSNRIDDKARGGLRYQAVVPTDREWAKPPSSATSDPSRDIHCFVVSKDAGQTESSVVHKIK
jgi:hypothetical protein